MSVPLLASERYLFRMLDTGSGLPDNSVIDMLMLPDGMMCIQTSSMLNFFDGARCRSYRIDPERIPWDEYIGFNNLYYDRDANMIWCATKDYVWIFDMDSRSFIYDIEDILQGKGFPDKVAENFFLDEDGGYWIVMGNDLWTCPAEGKAVRICLPEGAGSPVVMRQYGDVIYMLSDKGILLGYDMSEKSFMQFRNEEMSALCEFASRMEMAITEQGNIWIMFDKALMCYNTGNGELTHVDLLDLNERDLYTTIALDNTGRLYVGTARSGVSIVDGNGTACYTLPYLEMVDGKRIYHHTDIARIYVDARGGIWIATLSEGVLYWHEDIFRLETVNRQTVARWGMYDEGVKCMIEEDGGTVLIGTIEGLLRYDPVSGTITVPYEMLEDELCLSLYRDTEDRIWVGTFYNGAFCIDGENIRHYYWPEMSIMEMSYRDDIRNFNQVRTFYEDASGNFWISVYGGVGLFDPDTGEIELLRERHADLAGFMIVRDVCEVGEELLFSGDNGCFRYNPSSDEVSYDPGRRVSNIQSNQAILDYRGLLWIATSEGLVVTDTVSGKSYDAETVEAFPADKVMSMAFDGLGDLWLATFGDILRIRTVKDGIDEYSFYVSAFGRKDGVNSEAFFQKSVLVHSSGHLYFGGAHGICDVDPRSLYQENYQTSPLITSMMLSGEPLEVGKEMNGRIILPKELPLMDMINLKHDESFITFEFSNLNYTNPGHTSYRYQLVNFDDDWHEINSEAMGRAQYTFLKPGEYTFRVIASDNSFDWSEEAAEVHFRIRPPIWKSTAAYVFYVLLVLTASGLVIIYAYRRARKRLAEKREQENRKRQEELEQMKFRFFTDISHELRTPLSLILLPLESIMKEAGDSRYLSRLETMHDNALQLLALVNHLLDFRKLETGSEKLSLAKGSIADFVENAVQPFAEVAVKKGISIGFRNTAGNIVMAFDKDKVHKIVNNLLSNAMKFTPEHGRIDVHVFHGQDNMMCIEVRDTGIGIPAKDIVNIFDRYYRSENSTMTTGSGIGLNIVKQYAEMHGGKVGVSSEEGRGSVFIVSLPMVSGIQSGITAEDPEKSVQTDMPEKHYDDRKTVMVVEDNPEFRKYIVTELSSSYEVLEAQDGEECLSLLSGLNPDIIVSDIMMPKMDGLEMTRRIKGNIETSHIPVILLSARMSEDIRLEGYETGADAYITKPFSMSILEARIRNLLEERKRKMTEFSRNVDITPSEVAVTTIDEKLMTRIIESIERHIDNSEYSVDDLSADVAMHRMSLYRKLQSLVGMTPASLIRNIRLKRGAQLLRDDPHLSVSEVSYMVGFNTPKYFARYFKEMFGVLPSAYQKSAGKDRVTETEPEP